MQLLTVTVCVLWMTVSSALILLNKHLMASDGFHFPMALSGLGMAFSSVAAFLVCRVRVCVLCVLRARVCAGYACVLCARVTCACVCVRACVACECV